MSKTWTIAQLKVAIDKDLKECNNNFERGNCKVICIKEINILAISLPRKLTSEEIAILEEVNL